VTVVGLLREVFIVDEISGPRKFGPADSSNCRMRVTRFASFEIGRVIE
jgi:hypothetical protein